jgi:hypothetical protein
LIADRAAGITNAGLFIRACMIRDFLVTKTEFLSSPQ